jgi:hypothetical protein
MGSGAGLVERSPIHVTGRVWKQFPTATISLNPALDPDFDDSRLSAIDI